MHDHNSFLIEEMEDAKPGNPFNSDPFHMGQRVGKDTWVMSSNHSDKPCKYLIIVDSRTGKRIRITLP